MFIDLSAVQEEGYFEKLQAKEAEIKILEKEQRELVEKQRNTFRETVNDLDTLLRFLVANDYRFKNDKIDGYSLPQGPFLDKIGQELYFYDVESKRIKKYNLASKEEKIVSDIFFFEQCEIENVRFGLGYSLKLQEIHYRHITEDIKKRKISIGLV